MEAYEIVMLIQSKMGESMRRLRTEDYDYYFDADTIKARIDLLTELLAEIGDMKEVME